MVQHTRTLDFKIAFAIGLGTMIAAGIFSLSGKAVNAISSYAVVAFVIAAVIAGITAAAYSEFASIYSENGGGYLFCSRTFEERDLLTYAIGGSLFLGYTGTTAFYLATMDEWFFKFILPESIPILPNWIPVLPHGTTGVAAALLLGILNARGTEESGSFQLLVTGAKVGVLFAFIGGAFTFSGPVGAVEIFGTGFTSEAGSVSELVDLGPQIISISALAFITFFGFSAIAASAGEIIEPQKTVPRAIAASMITVTVLYTFVIVAMVNAPDETLQIIKTQGETGMGTVAAVFLGDAGRSLIVAGAIFSMVSASNASILAASSIGSLMGRRGQAPRRFSRIHPEYGTPTWSVGSATAVIVALIVGFIALFPEEVTLFGTTLAGGLEALTGFATLNLLLPLSVVNIALIYSRRRFPDIKRGFSVPGVPIVPIIGVIANLALITNLPPIGVGIGILLTIALLIAYLAWGGAPEIEELFERVVPPRGAEQAGDAAQGVTPNGGQERYRVLVPVARPENAPTFVKLAAAIARSHADELTVQVVNVTELPDQTPNELVSEDATKRVDRIQELIDAEDLDINYTVEGHLCRDVAFDILQTAREDQADLILMGHPKERPDITEKIEFEAPCDVVYAGPDVRADQLDVINIGVGGGPHQQALVKLANELGGTGSEVHLTNVTPTGVEGTGEDPDQTLSELTDVETVNVHNVTSDSVADGLVSTASETGGVLFIGASRDRRLRRWVFGSTPDRVIERSADADVPVLVYASTQNVPERLEDYLFPVYQYLRGKGRHMMTGSSKKQLPE
jgi:amino acid transporter/nucleotide-binding universal stress UspA family protein